MNSLSTPDLLLQKIARVLKQDDTVLFIGAGISRWAGLPSWLQLLEELADYVEEQGQSGLLVRKEIEANDFLQAASYGVHQLTKPQFAEFILRTCRVGKAAPHEIHEKLTKLGPKCFVTTNYDHLIEDGLAKWCPGEFFKIVSNKQVTETADIIQAKASHFVFKPHGDVSDSDSVILTREQYRLLQMERIYILKALETLMVTRPVVFLGYALRDLDFMYVKDLLANTYKGGAVDHYAIMPDVSPTESSYWRTQYGIHILSYPTTAVDGHASLLTVLDQLVKARTVIESRPPSAISHDLEADKLLALTRYAARFRSLRVDADVHLPLRVTLKDYGSFSKRRDVRRFDYSLVEHLLRQVATHSVLLGNPGAGKSYAFRRASAAIARDLQDKCLQGSVRLSDLTIPVYVDMKLYKGDLQTMIEQQLPPEITLASLLEFAAVRVFVDSVNEMPRDYLSTGEYETDFQRFLAENPSCICVFGSRTDEAFVKFDIPKFELSEIDLKFVASYMIEREQVLEGVFQQEVLSLLQKPLFFRIYQQGHVDFSTEVHPKQVYRSLFTRLIKEATAKFGLSSIEEVLAPIAFDLIDQGQEAIALSEFRNQLRQLHNADAFLKETGDLDFVNWLISKELLVPAPESRLTFFHQSITEYLAGLQVSKLYRNTPEALNRILKYMRWDQSLFTALGFLTHEESKQFVGQVIDTDHTLAIRAAKFVEHDRDEVVDGILNCVYEKQMEFDDQMNLSYLLDELPISSVHDEILRKFQEKGDAIGGAALQLRANLHGERLKPLLIDELFRCFNDYNYCVRVGEALQSFLMENDVPGIIERVASIKVTDPHHEGQGVISGLKVAFGALPITRVVDLFPHWRDLTNVQFELLCDILRDSKTDYALRKSVELVTEGASRGAIVSTYFRVNYPEGRYEIEPSLFDESFITALIHSLVDEEAAYWALELIDYSVKLQPKLSLVVSSEAERKTGLAKTALLACAGDQATFWSEMSKLAAASTIELESAPLYLLKGLPKVDWSGHEPILMGLLRKRNPKLARYLIEPMILNASTPNLDVSIDPVEWWLQWIEEVELSQQRDSHWFADRLGTFWMTFSKKANSTSVLEEFNANSRFRKIILDFFLPKMSDLSSDMLSEEAVSFLLANLVGIDEDDDLLGTIATEDFVRSKLLPMVNIKREPLASNLRRHLRIAGGRHGQRYITELT